MMDPLVAGQPEDARRAAPSPERVEGQDERPSPRVAEAGQGAERSSDSPPEKPAESPSLAAGRRLIESLVVAVVTSTGVYLVGSVYTEAYYGRMSIDANALDWPTTYVALQAVHALQSLLVYPVVVLLLYLLDRFVTARLPRPRSWLVRQIDRFGSLAILVINGLVVLPLIVAAVAAGSNPALIQTTSALSEVVSLMQVTGLALLVYVVWLSLERRAFLVAELRRRQIVPLVLVIAVYLLGALVNTANRARYNAERLMTGASDASLAVTFVMADDMPPLPSANLILVAMRNGHHFVVERQPDPPSRAPRSYAVPFRAVDSVEMERVNLAPPSDDGIVISLNWLTSTPAP